MAQFVRIVEENGDQTLLNLDRLISVEEVRPGHCCLCFGGRDRIHIEGPGADKLIETLGTIPILDARVKYEELDLPEPVDMRQLGMPRFPEGL